VVLRKLILGLVDTLPIGKSWRFFSQDTLPEFSESITLSSENEIQNVDFLGIKLGDVNYNANPLFTSLVTRSVPPSMYWATEAIEYKTADIVNIPIKCATRDKVSGFQFTLSDPDLEFLGIKQGVADIMEDDYGLLNDHLTMCWFSVSPLPVQPGDVLFTIQARAKTNGSLQNGLSLSSGITKAEVYDENETVFIPQLKFQHANAQELILNPCEPNPLQDNGTISFYLLKGDQISFKVYSSKGQMQYNLDRYYNAGWHDIVIDKKDFTQSGLMVYTLQYSTGMQTGKMIIID
jgi:hypothetical protein